MGVQVTMGAVLTCSFGAAPCSLVVLPTACTMAGSLVTATIMDYKPMVNIATFGMCSSPANPTVISATAAALGVLTPMPCIPATAAPWTPGSATVQIGGYPALTNSCTCMCSYGGSITITSPGQATVQVA